MPGTVETSAAKSAHPDGPLRPPRSSAPSAPAPAAPVAAAPTSAERTFIEQIAPGAMAAQRKYGVPAAVTIAQAIVESGWGSSTLAAQDHNLFGIKGTGPAGGVFYPTTEYVNGRPVTRTAEFRVYHDVAQSIDDHGKLLADSGYYGQAMASRHDPDAFANALTGVYATDPHYGTKIIGMMQQYHLYRYDAPAPAAPHTADAPTPGGSSTGGAPRRSAPGSGGSGPAPTPGPNAPGSGQAGIATIPGLPFSVPPKSTAPAPASPTSRPPASHRPSRAARPTPTPSQSPGAAPTAHPDAYTSPAPATPANPARSAQPRARPAPGRTDARRAPRSTVLRTAAPQGAVTPRTASARTARPSVEAVSPRRPRPSAEYLPPRRELGSTRTGRARSRDEIPPAVRNAFNLMAKAPLMAKKTIYEDVASHTGVGWQLLAACDWMQCKAQTRYSPVHGEKLGTANPDGTMYRTKSEALEQCAEDLIEVTWEVYEIDLPAQARLSVSDLASVFAAFRWGGLLKAHHTSALEFPYSVAGLTEAHLHMRWPSIDDPNAPDKPGAKFRMPFGAVPVVLSLNYPAVD